MNDEAAFDLFVSAYQPSGVANVVNRGVFLSALSAIVAFEAEQLSVPVTEFNTLDWHHVFTETELVMYRSKLDRYDTDTKQDILELYARIIFLQKRNALSDEVVLSMCNAIVTSVENLCFRL